LLCLSHQTFILGWVRYICPLLVTVLAARPDLARCYAERFLDKFGVLGADQVNGLGEAVLPWAIRPCSFYEVAGLKVKDVALVKGDELIYEVRIIGKGNKERPVKPVLVGGY